MFHMISSGFESASRMFCRALFDAAGGMGPDKQVWGACVTDDTRASVLRWYPDKQASYLGKPPSAKTFFYTFLAPTGALIYL